MGFLSIIGIILVLSILLFIFWSASIYNTLVRLNNLVQEGWSGIDVQLKRRYDLIPNLVAVVKQYSIHETDVLENVTRMRAISMDAKGIDERAKAEVGLSGALKTLFAVSENYPNLKANENFLALQKDLTKIEEEIQLARRYYNGAARNYNIVVEGFPSKYVANFAAFRKAPYFELASEKEREAPKVTF